MLLLAELSESLRSCGTFSNEKYSIVASNDGTPILACMGYRIGADENPFGTGAKEEL